MTLVRLRTSTPSRRFSGVAASGSGGSRGALVDRSGRRVRYLRVSLTDRCNYRCTYCMPEVGSVYGPREDLLSLEEIVEMCAAFARRGVERVRLTGGEPTLRRGLVELVARLGAITTERGSPLEVVLTTNGERLASLAAPLRAAGLRGLTVSLDSLDPIRFRRITRRGDLSAVLAGLEAARQAGFGSLKINTVAVRGFNDDELGDLVRFAWDRDLVPRFIEVMPMAGGRLFIPGEMLPGAEIRARLAEMLGTALDPDEARDIRGSGPARYVRVRTGPYRGRRVGTISALTENFCADCNRLRVSATGQLHGCLAHDDTGDLRAALRGPSPAAALDEVVRGVLGTKRERHGFNVNGTGGPTKPMVSIGG